MEITEFSNDSFLAGKLGCITEGNSGKIALIAPNSPAEKSGLHPSDEIVAVNDIIVAENTIDWVNYFGESLNLTLKKGGKLVNVKVEIDHNDYFKKYRISKIKKPNANQKKLYNKWLWL